MVPWHAEILQGKIGRLFENAPVGPKRQYWVTTSDQPNFWITLDEKEIKTGSTERFRDRKQWISTSLWWALVRSYIWCSLDRELLSNLSKMVCFKWSVLMASKSPAPEKTKGKKRRNKKKKRKAKPFSGPGEVNQIRHGREDSCSCF